MKQIALTKGKVALVDDEDFGCLNQFKWHFCSGYASRNITIDGKQVQKIMHRLIMNTPESMDTHHINHNKLDNRVENLRVCTRSQNQMGRKPHKGSKSKYKGVCWDKNKSKWLARAKVNNKSKFLGRFKNEEDAALAYNTAALESFGEFALLNKI